MLEQFNVPKSNKMHRMLDINPDARPTVGDSLNHPWLVAFKNKRKEEDDISEVLEIDIDDDTKSEVHVYRDALYTKLRSYRKTDDKVKRRMFFFGGRNNSARQ